MKGPSIMLIAGEVSGDMQAACLVRALRRRRPDLRFFGIGGGELRRAGMETLYDVREMAVLGLSEVLRRYFFFRRVFHAMLTVARERRPAAVILVDYPGFNLRFAARAHARGLKTIYYICPQVWAWHRGRIPHMARIVDRLIAIFPFEARVFEGTALPVSFVGHPLVTAARAALAEPRAALPWQGEPYIALLPGSRMHEVRRILPVLWRAAERIERDFPVASFIVAAPTEDVAQWVRATIAALPGGPVRWKLVVGQTRQVLRQARAAWVASGTATLEAALMRCPMVVVYKVAWPTYWLGRWLIHVPYLGMVNIVAGERICPEFIQGAATPEALAKALEPLLREGRPRADMLRGLERVTQALGEPGAEERAADAVLAELA